MVGAGAPPSDSLFKGLGASPVTIVWTDLYSSLRGKVIDALAMTVHGAIAMNLIDACSSMSFFGHADWNGYTIDLDGWNKMPPKTQQILQEEIDTTSKWVER